MPENDTLGFRPSNRQKQLISRYQEMEGDPDEPVKKSDAVSFFVDLGLEQYYGGFADTFFIELSKASLFVALTLTMIWWASGFATLAALVALDNLAYVMFGLSLGSAVVHYSGSNPLTWLVDALRRSGDERGA